LKCVSRLRHIDPKSFCHAVLQQFTKGLEDTGHINETIDLYAIGFDPVLKLRDLANWLPDENAPDVVEKVNRRVFDKNAPLFQQISAWFMFRRRSPLEIVTLLGKRGPKNLFEKFENSLPSINFRL
jgi:NAD(P)H dehydrogenase (quinone)